MELIKVEIEVSGQPRGKGRPRFTRNGHTYTDAKTKEYDSLYEKFTQIEAEYLKLEEDHKK